MLKYVLLASALLMSGSAFARSSHSNSKMTLSIVAPERITLTTQGQVIESLSVRAADLKGNPIAGATIEFLTDFTTCIPLDPACVPPAPAMYGHFETANTSAMTDASGIATIHRYIGGEASGTYQIAALLDPSASAKNASLVDDSRALSVQFDVEQDFASASFTIKSGISGSWYDPLYSGQGFNLEVIDTSTSPQLVAYFYTFDATGHNLWMTGVGQIVGADSIVPMYKVDGGTFPPLFDANAITHTHLGQLKFHFTDCNHGTVGWQPDPAQVATFGGTGFSIQRITSLSGLTCQ